MSILSPTESIAFQSFLSSIDLDGFHGPTPTEWSLYHHGNPDQPDSLHPKAKDALKKATMDLMSLDTPSSSSSSHNQAPSWPNPPSSDPTPHFRYPMGRDDLPPRPPKRPSSSTTPSPTPPLTHPSSSKRSFDKVASGTGSAKQQPTPKRRRSSPPPPSPPPSAAGSSRPALLSASQKRANHIQSEQKRRANIRKGYEALCETVPALREAIRKEEEEAAAMGTLPASSSAAVAAKGGSRRKKGKSSADDDKVDGRAGPKSENVVLQKTIDYIQDLNSAKEGLLQRLANARARLPPTHPSQKAQSDPIWDREWTGGVGNGGGDDDEGMGSDDES